MQSNFLPADLADFLQHELAVGRYASAQHVFCDAVRLLKQRQEELIRCAARSMRRPSNWIAAKVAPSMPTASAPKSRVVWRRLSSKSPCRGPSFLPWPKTTWWKSGYPPARDKPLAAEEFIAKIEEQFQLLANHPGLGETQAALGKGVRRLTLGNYLIFFRRRDESVEILRVLQGSRDIRSLQ